MKKIIYVILSCFILLSITSCNKAERDYYRIIGNKQATMSDYTKYINKYPNSSYASAIADTAAIKIIRSTNIYDIREREYFGSDVYEISSRVSRFISDESSLWEIVTQKDDANSYDYFLEQFPNSSHCNEAYRLLIERDVAEAFAGKHGIMPEMDKGRRTGKAYSTIEIENRTEYVLTISYSGPDYKRIKVPPHNNAIVNIGNGYYDIAARVKASNVTPYVGQEILDGSYYSSSYYISTTSFRYRY